MPREETILIYKFDELSDEAKEKARSWYREHGFNYEWWDFVYDYIAECADTIGIDLRTREWTDREGEKHYDGINILFSGFSSQGDGACFNGTYQYKKGSLAAVKKLARNEERLHRIAADLQIVQRRAFYRLKANITPGHLSNRYSHYNTRDITVEDAHVECGHDGMWSQLNEDGIKEALKTFMQWMYRKLEESWNDINSDESVDDTIQANEYEFHENGTRA